MSYDTYRLQQAITRGNEHFGRPAPLVLQVGVVVAAVAHVYYALQDPESGLRPCTDAEASTNGDDLLRLVLADGSTSRDVTHRCFLCERPVDGDDEVLLAFDGQNRYWPFDELPAGQRRGTRAFDSECARMILETGGRIDGRVD